MFKNDDNSIHKCFGIKGNSGYYKLFEQNRISNSSLQEPPIATLTGLYTFNKNVFLIVTLFISSISCQEGISRYY